MTAGEPGRPIDLTNLDPNEDEDFRRALAQSLAEHDQEQRHKVIRSEAPFSDESTVAPAKEQALVPVPTASVPFTASNNDGVSEGWEDIVTPKGYSQPPAIRQHEVQFQRTGTSSDDPPAKPAARWMYSLPCAAKKGANGSRFHRRGGQHSSHNARMRRTLGVWRKESTHADVTAVNAEDMVRVPFLRAGRRDIA